MASQPWQLSRMSEDNARLCIRAAELKARGWKWQAIADELGLGSAIAARKCAETGYGLVPGDDLRMARRLAADELDALRREFWKVVEDPGPVTTPAGVVVTDPVTGEPVADRAVRVAALNGLRAVNAEYRHLFGTDAPKQRVTVSASASLEEIQALVAQARAEVEQAETRAGPLALPAVVVPVKD